MSLTFPLIITTSDAINVLFTTFKLPESKNHMQVKLLYIQAITAAVASSSVSDPLDALKTLNPNKLCSLSSHNV